MELLNKLKEQGWHLTEEGLKKIEAASPGADVKKIIAAALDWDFREIAGGALSTAKKDDTLPGRLVLQIQKIRNIAAPKANEESKVAPRLLQVEFTDGQAVVQGLELEPITALSLNLPPGTKVYFRPERLQLMQGFVVLKAAELQVLGGNVENLVEKWELARTMLKYARSGRRISGSSGPPPWIAFGKKLEIKDSLPNERNFKSLQAALDKDKEISKENEEFNAMRTEAIAEATKAGSRKIFGGGNQQIVDHNVKKILEKGYNEEDAKYALRSTNNNLERALYNLKRREENKRSNEKLGSSSIPMSATNGRGGRNSLTRELGGGKRGAASAKDEAAAAKPASNVSLFDFLTNKLPTSTETITNTTATTSAAPTSSQPVVNSSSNFQTNNRYEKSKSDVTKSNFNSGSNNNSNSNKPPAQDAAGRPKFENNISSSFAANRTTPGPRSGRQEREPYNAAERQTNTRFSNTSGGGRGSGRGGGRGGYQSGNRGSYEDNANRNYQQRSGGGAANESSSRSSINSNFNANNNRNNRNSHERAPPAGSNEKPQQHSSGSYDSRRTQDYQNKGHDKPRYNQKENSNNYQGNNNRNYDANSNRQQSTYNAGNSNNSAPPATSNVNNSNNSSSINKLVDSTSKLKIDKPRDSGRNQQRSQNRPQHHQQQQHQPQQQQQQQYSAQQMQPIMAQQYQHPAAVASPHQLHQQMLSNQAQSNFTQLPNGFSYDPSKIIGFQSKETNEYAMTLLKNQGLAAASANAGAQQQQPLSQPPTHYVPSTSPLQMQPPPQQPPSPFTAPAAFMLPTPQALPPSAYGMMPHGESWMWKIGDLCLAKYWDDGRYYEAEITGISDSTCVVLFLDYGNFEEVLKSDCLPFTDANHRPVNQYSGPPGHLAGMPPSQAPPSRMHLANATQNRGLPNRYRGERQVYVPPPKREN